MTSVARPITIQQQERYDRFIVEWAKDFNATQAYLRAFGPAANASVRAAALCKHPYVREHIDRISRQRLTLADVTASRVVMELARIGFADLRRTVHVTTMPDGSRAQAPLPLSQMDEDTARAMREIEYQADGTLRMRMHDKQSALLALARITGAMPDGRADAVGNRARTISDAHESVAEDEILLMLAEYEAADSEYTDDGETWDVDVDPDGEG